MRVGYKQRRKWNSETGRESIFITPVVMKIGTIHVQYKGSIITLPDTVEVRFMKVLLLRGLSGTPFERLPGHIFMHIMYFVAHNKHTYARPPISRKAFANLRKQKRGIPRVHQEKNPKRCWYLPFCSGSHYANDWICASREYIDQFKWEERQEFETEDKCNHLIDTRGAVRRDHLKKEKAERDPHKHKHKHKKPSRRVRRNRRPYHF